ncbi:type II toxin-antitoxin system VapC family toxin [Streptosporangium album]|uniref:type II toxin-antitoxin system VapC family toxin n=1 Tax=Streptosporangium album TaxID=47479 RepID=UPI0028B0E0BD|nr:PIN domain-containing protein [Streptosporangium album]
MKKLLCDSGPLIATSDRRDTHHSRCVQMLGSWPGSLVIPEPVLGETCNFLRNNIRRGAFLEATLLEQLTAGDYEIVNPTQADRRRATELVRHMVAAPLGYVDATVIAMAERLHITDVATTDLKFVGMAQGITKIRPLAWPFHELP